MTCVGSLDSGQANPDVVLSGSKDGTLTMWDIRSKRIALYMAIADPAKDSAMVRLQRTAHDATPQTCTPFA